MRGLNIIIRLHTHMHIQYHCSVPLIVTCGYLPKIISCALWLFYESVQSRVAIFKQSKQSEIRRVTMKYFQITGNFAI